MRNEQATDSRRAPCHAKSRSHITVKGCPLPACSTLEAKECRRTEATRQDSSAHNPGTTSNRGTWLGPERRRRLRARWVESKAKGSVKAAQRSKSVRRIHDVPPCGWSVQGGGRRGECDRPMPKPRGRSLGWPSPGTPRWWARGGGAAQPMRAHTSPAVGFCVLLCPDDWSLFK